MNPPFTLSTICGAVLQSINDPRTRARSYVDTFNVFDALIRQLPENHAIAALLMVKRYGCPQIVPRKIRYA